jgi:hypothetical protein
MRKIGYSMSPEMEKEMLDEVMLAELRRRFKEKMDAILAEELEEQSKENK